MTVTKYAEMTIDQRKAYAAQQANAAYTNGDIPMFFFWEAVANQPIPRRYGYTTSYTFQKSVEHTIFTRKGVRKAARHE
jgi:hypothetical protein